MRFLLPILILASAHGVLAQGDNAIIERSFERAKNGTGVAMQNKSFSDSGAFRADKFETAAFQGAKSASTKEFSTKSFFGIKNPWLGKDVYDTRASTIADRSARESDKKLATDGYDVRAYDPAAKTSPLDEERVKEVVEQKVAVVEPKAQGGVDQFTQNLSKDLSIDDVRDLLNKGTVR